MKVNRGNSNEHKQHTIINIIKKITLNYSNIIVSAAVGFFLGTQEHVQNSLGKQAINVRAIEVLL